MGSLSSPGVYPHAGTPPYASIASHRGLSLSPLSDLESVGYLISDLYHGSLPWLDEIKNAGRLPARELDRFLQGLSTRMADMKERGHLFGLVTFPEMAAYMDIVRSPPTDYIYDHIYEALGTVEGEYPWYPVPGPPQSEPRPLKPLDVYPQYILDIAPPTEPMAPPFVQEWGKGLVKIIQKK